MIATTSSVKLLAAATCAFALLLATTPTALALTLTTLTVEGDAGSTVEIPVRMDEADKLGPIQFRLSYNPDVLQIVDVTTGDDYEGAAIYKESEPGAADIFLTSNAEEGVEGDGTLVVLLANVVGEAGQASPLQLQYVEAFERDTTAPVYIDVVTLAGELVVVEPRQPWLYWGLIGGVACFALMLIVPALFRSRTAPADKADNDRQSNGAGVKSCAACGVGNVGTAKFCGECGNALE